MLWVRHFWGHSKSPLPFLSWCSKNFAKKENWYLCYHLEFQKRYARLKIISNWKACLVGEGWGTFGSVCCWEFFCWSRWGCLLGGSCSWFLERELWVTTEHFVGWGLWSSQNTTPAAVSESPRGLTWCCGCITVCSWPTCSRPLGGL